MIIDRFSTAFRDGLSGLYSEAYFIEVFQREWNRMLREQDALSILIMHPHLNIEKEDDQFAFKVLSEMVESSTKRSTDLVCRFQNNEIAIGLFNLDEDGTETIVHRIINGANELTEVISNLDISIGGLNILPSNQIEINEMFEITERLACKAEGKGKNAYEVQYYQVH